jgi:hypothetical protein
MNPPRLTAGTRMDAAWSKPPSEDGDPVLEPIVWRIGNWHCDPERRDLQVHAHARRDEFGRANRKPAGAACSEVA